MVEQYSNAVNVAIASCQAEQGLTSLIYMIGVSSLKVRILLFKSVSIIKALNVTFSNRFLTMSSLPCPPLPSSAANRWSSAYMYTQHNAWHIGEQISCGYLLLQPLTLIPARELLLRNRLADIFLVPAELVALLSPWLLLDETHLLLAPAQN